MARKSSKASPLDDELRRLYRLPLGEFTAVRNSLAKQLQKAGDGDAANEVKALPKPSVSAWVVNQLFAREEGHMRSLLDAGERARKALQHTLTVGDAETLRDALQEQREQRDALRKRAADILSKDLRNPSQAILDRVTVNLDALALSPGAAEEAARGWLDRDLEPPGFEVLSGLQFAARPERRGLRLVPPPAEKKPAPKSVEEKPSEKKPAAKKATAEAERRRKAEETAREREEARRRERIERAQEKVDRLAAEADTLRREAERAERTAAEAEKAAQEAARRAGLARQDAERIRRRAERAADDVDRAEKDLESARRLS